MRGVTRIRGAAVVAALLLLTSCAGRDFGGPPHWLVPDETYNYDVRPSLTDLTGSIGARGLEFTDDERLLRELAAPLTEPGYDRHQWDTAAGEDGVIESGRIGVYDRTAYAGILLSSRYRSPSARYAQLIDDIRNDSTRMPQFFETAWRVRDIDRKREKSFPFLSNLSSAERELALRRMHENLAITRLVQDSLARRASSYSFALERLVLMTPSPQAVDVEHALNQLKAQIAQYRSGTPPRRNRVVGLGR
jgi:hypothetical protein